MDIPLSALCRTAEGWRRSVCKSLHEQDLREGFGSVWLPDALARKYPNAATEWPWQFVFPSAGLSRDPETALLRRHHVYDKTLQGAMKRAVKRAGINKRASLHTLRHSFAIHRLRSPPRTACGGSV